MENRKLVDDEMVQVVYENMIAFQKVIEKTKKEIEIEPRAKRKVALQHYIEAMQPKVELRKRYLKKVGFSL